MFQIPANEITITLPPSLLRMWVIVTGSPALGKLAKLNELDQDDCLQCVL